MCLLGKLYGTAAASLYTPPPPPPHAAAELLHSPAQWQPHTCSRPPMAADAPYSQRLYTHDPTQPAQPHPPRMTRAGWREKKSGCKMMPRRIRNSDCIRLCVVLE